MDFSSFIQQHSITPFKSINIKRKTPFRSREARRIHTKVCRYISSYFHLPGTAGLLAALSADTPLKECSHEHLENLPRPCPSWSPDYDLLIITDDLATYQKLKKMDAPCRMMTESALQELYSYDVVRSVHCEISHPHIIECETLEEAYPEYFLTLLSAWETIIERCSYAPLLPLLPLLKQEKMTDISLDRANALIEEQLRDVTIRGSALLSGTPPEVKQLVDRVLKECGIPSRLVKETLPLEFDQEALEEHRKKQQDHQQEEMRKRISAHKDHLFELPIFIQELQEDLLLTDLYGGITRYRKEHDAYPIEEADHICLKGAFNLFLDDPQPLHYDVQNASILTGANSGGKTTLLEHILQIISLAYMGLPAPGHIKMPSYDHVYYFAKNKGSASKGAFETLLSQLSKVRPGSLVLADEMEAVTEPGVAARIIRATINHFLRQDCHLLFAS
ncbi:MAG: hypothetical protein ACOCWQ_04625, partial [Nanoarchaeota archaeon]